MGAKIELCFLARGENNTLIKSCIEVLEKNGWFYNQHIPGEYTVWLDGPIWKFGKSRTVFEGKQATNPVNLSKSNVFSQLVDTYSPLIVLGSIWFGEPLAGRLGIVESKTEWKQVTFSLDWHDAIDRLDFGEKLNAIDRLKISFREMARSIKAYYGIGGIELTGVADQPRVIDNGSLIADIMYFSTELIQNHKVNTDKNEYTIETYNEGSLFLCRKTGIFELS